MIYLDTPNHQNDIYLEVSRNSLAKRGVVTIACLPAMIWFLTTPTLIIDTLALGNIELIVIGITSMAAAIWTITLGLRMDISPPRDEPIRFNRARQRIYAYNFKYRWWNPFERWRVIPVAYDWPQVRAERWKQRGTTAQGALIIKWGVVLSIVEPGTNKVIDRFPLSTMGADAHAWAYVCTYMQQGPDALPPPGPPWDHNDVLWCNVAMLLAPKVEWPAEMDLESRTAP